MVLNKNRRTKRGNSTAKLIIIFTILIGLVFVVRFCLLREKSKQIPQGQDQTTSASLLTATSTTNIALWSKLRDHDGVFELSYPRKIFKRNDRQVISPLADQAKEKSISLAHTVPVKHCGLSGLPENCTASTTDMSVNFFTIDKSFNDIYSELKKAYGSNMDVITIDGHQGVRFSQGAEGEGMVYIVLPINDAKTLFISRSYTNEQVLSQYQPVKEFIKFDEQKTLFDQILSTFSFRPGVQ